MRAAHLVARVVRPRAGDKWFHKSPARKKQVPQINICGTWTRGDEGIRTPDILLAKQALYQLSYVPGPVVFSSCPDVFRFAPVQKRFGTERETAGAA